MVKRLYIFEGPDGCGKTTAACKLADAIDAKYAHFGPLPEMTQIGEVYARAMLPAYLGYEDVVMDRCWLSEQPYGDAFRGGKNRLSDQEVNRLTNIAKACRTIVIKCRVPWEVCSKVFDSRPEMLKNKSQLRSVYDAYGQLDTNLPTTVYDWTENVNILNFLLKDKSV